jgi:hypothetical protein
MHRPVKVTHSSFIEGLHITKNTASEAFQHKYMHEFKTEESLNIFTTFVLG